MSESIPLLGSFTTVTRHGLFMNAKKTRSRENGNGCARRACRECSRRKSKCDRLIPACSPCQRYKRVCDYERQEKTPLTRRHLSHVEAELSRTRELLKNFTSQRQNGSCNETSSVSQERNFQTDFESVRRVSFQPETSSNYIWGRIPTTGTSAQSPSPQQGDASANTVISQSPGSPRPHSGITPSVTSQDRYHSPGVGSPAGASSNVLSLESPPTSGDFEWDERSSRSGGYRFVDGMVNLTTDVNDSGYLGVVSGAALLRMTGDAYFSLYHRSYPILHEATFRAQFMEIIPRPPGNAWQVLLYIVSAIGAWSTATQPTEVDLGLFEAAKSRFSIDLIETGSIILVQALALLSNYAQKRNRPNSSYNYYGLARRIAMGIGLHKEFSNWQPNFLALEVRRRVWWCLYVFDIGSIITFSRPLDFPQSGIEAELPLNVHDSDITPSTRQRPLPADETTLYTHLRSQCMFHMATCKIYSCMISKPFPTANEMVRFDDLVIGQWLASLPSFFQEHAIQSPKYKLCHCILHWRYRNFRVLMFRPFLVHRVTSRLNSGNEPANDSGDKQIVDIAFQRCLDAASESVTLISKFWFENEKTMMASWYGLYFLFQAILIPIICLRNDPRSDMASSWRDQIFEATHVLESMMELNPTATRCLDVVKSLCQPYMSVDGGVDSPTQDSTLAQLTDLYPLIWPTLEAAQFDGVETL
ncbi:fungal-specific transcription factor domain-containing protein [Xylogone sp. PMI_703]|nr:fungal-specific transcription factor domain-containing protein [Xylogone sp. PMI_703]